MFFQKTRKSPWSNKKITNSNMDDPKIQPSGDKNPHEIPLDQLAGEQKPAPEAPAPQTPPSPETPAPQTPPSPETPTPQTPPAPEAAAPETPAAPQTPPAPEPSKLASDELVSLQNYPPPPSGDPPKGPASEPSSPDPQKKNLFKYIIIGISVVILLAVGYLAYGFLSGDAQPEVEIPVDRPFTPPEEENETEDDLEDVINDLREIYEIDESPPGLHFDVPEMDDEITEEEEEEILDPPEERILR